MDHFSDLCSSPSYQWLETKEWERELSLWGLFQIKCSRLACSDRSSYSVTCGNVGINSVSTLLLCLTTLFQHSKKRMWQWLERFVTISSCGLCSTTQPVPSLSHKLQELRAVNMPEYMIQLNNSMIQLARPLRKIWRHHMKCLWGCRWLPGNGKTKFV